MNPPVCQRLFHDADLRAHGCTLASLTYIAGEVTDGKAWVDAEGFAARLRNLSGVAVADFRERGTTITEAQAAYQALRFDGRVPPVLRLFRGAKVREELLPALTGGRLALVAVNYGAIQDAGQGVGSFRGGHACVIGAPIGDSVPVADPLRQKVVTWKVDLLVKAMETFGKRPWGNGRGEAAVAEPVPTQIEVVTKQRDKARRDLALALQKVKDQDKRIAELEGQPQADCTAAVNAERARVLDLISSGVDELLAGIR